MAFKIKTEKLGTRASLDIQLSWTGPGALHRYVESWKQDTTGALITRITTAPAGATGAQFQILMEGTANSDVAIYIADLGVRNLTILKALT